jgi:NADH dehydrogenase FAD-containing subunit
LIPSHIGHIQAQAESYEPGTNQVVLNDGSKVSYDYLVVAPGLKLSMSNSSCPSVSPFPRAMAEGDEEEEGQKELRAKADDRFRKCQRITICPRGPIQIERLDYLQLRELGEDMAVD